MCFTDEYDCTDKEAFSFRQEVTNYCTTIDIIIVVHSRTSCHHGLAHERIMLANSLSQDATQEELIFDCTEWKHSFSDPTACTLSS